MATSESTEKVLTGPIKIYKDKVVISNLTLAENGEVNGIDASLVGAVSAEKFSKLSTLVDNIFDNGVAKLGEWTQNNDLLTFEEYSIGGEKTPIYFKEGIPTACDESLDVDISGNAASATTLVDLSASIEELNYIVGATNNIQGQINNLNTSLSDLNAGLSTLNTSLSNYLPLSGGTLTGNVTIGQSTDTQSRWVRARNQFGTVYLDISDAGNRGVYDSEIGWIIHADKDDNIIIKDYPKFTYNSNTKTLTITTPAEG